MNEKLVKIGATMNPHGLKGELKVFIEEQYEEDFLETDTVFLTLAGKKIPYFIEAVRGGNAMIVKFEDVDTIEAATKIAKKDMEIRATDLIPDEERELDIIETYKYLEGFMLHDESIWQIAEIDEVIDMPHQEIAVVVYQNKEILIPLNEKLIVSIDEDKKVILMDLPEGLLTL
jgi:16S rRNA processing protein RimM